MYFETMRKKLQKISVELTKPPSNMEKLQSLLHAIVGGWYMNKLNDNFPPLKKMKLTKRAQKEEVEIKRNLQTANKNWNDRKFHIHWNELEWVNSRNCNEQKKPVLFVF